MRIDTTARALAMAIAVFASVDGNAADVWRVMPDGFQTMSFLRPAAPSDVAGTLRIEGEGRSSLDRAVDLMNLDPQRRYEVRFRPVGWCEPNVRVDLELPRVPSPDPALADRSWIGSVAPFSADTHGQASFLFVSPAGSASTGTP